MWVDLSNAEIELIVSKLGNGPLVDKLSARPHSQTGAFAMAAEGKAAANNENMVVEETGVIERHDFGAYVMTWLWVSDGDADVPTSFEGFPEANALHQLFKDLPAFRLSDLTHSSGSISAWGKMDDFEWKFQTAGLTWVLAAFSQSGRHADWLHIEQWFFDVPTGPMTPAYALSCIGSALQILATKLTGSGVEHHPLQSRKYLELYAFGAIPAEEALKWINVSLRVLDAKAQPIRETIERMREEGGPVRFAGPGIPRFDLEPEKALA